jgi:hypothetical protein
MAVTTKTDVIGEAFSAVNSFKRHRTLRKVKQTTQDKQYHELKMYELFDQLELALRAIQRAVRQGELEMAEEDMDDEETDA